MRKSRRGAASIIGTVIFVIVFMLALGSFAYVSELQSEANQAAAQAQSVDVQRARESLTFLTSQGGLAASDQGASSVSVNHLILRFANGTVYSLNATASIPVGGQALVQPLVPVQLCSPGSATCLSKYQAIVTGAAPGSSVGLVTSLGNVFWYSGGASGSGWSKVVFTASGTWAVPAGAVEAYVLCVGGGGGGGGSGGVVDLTNVDGGGGGGGGGVGSVAQGFVPLGGVAQVSVTVGAGGSGGSAGTQSIAGGNGGDGKGSAFGEFIACGGGGGGTGSVSSSNAGNGRYCYLGESPGGAGAGVPGGDSGVSGAASDALQATAYGGGGGGGGGLYFPPGAGSPSDALDSGAPFTSTPGASGSCAFGGGGGSASPLSDGGTGGAGATSCGAGQQGQAGAANSGAGGGGAGGSLSSSLACGYQPGTGGGAGGSGVVVVYYQ